MERELRTAIDAIVAGRDEAGLVALLAAWRKKKLPALADRIDEVSARIRRPPVTATKSMQAGWLARAAENDPADIDALLDVLGDARKVELAARLAALPVDPRVTVKLVALLRSPPLIGPAGRGVSAQMLEMLVASGDPRAAALLAEADLGRLRRLGRFVQGKLAEALPKLAAIRAPELPKTAELLLAELDAALAAKKTRAKVVARDGDALLAAVHAAPDDDDARLVYADFLLESGDPRGELIVLQCERARTGGPVTKRETELLKTYARAWLGPLEPVILKKGLVYERGFLARCEYAAQRTVDSNAALGHPLWSTVVEVGLRSARMDAPRILSHPVCEQVRTLTDVSREILVLIQNRNFEHVGIRYFRLDAATADALASHSRLRRIDIDEGSLDELRDFVDERLPSVRMLTLRRHRGEQLVRGEDGTWARTATRR